MEYCANWCPGLEKVGTEGVENQPTLKGMKRPKRKIHYLQKVPSPQSEPNF